MKPNEKMTDGQGNEVALFPMEYLYLSTARNPAEHQLLAMDFFGWTAQGRTFDVPCYAPFTCRVTYTGNDHNMICQSVNPVRYVDGTLDYATVLVAHSDTAPPVVGTIIQQGDLWYHTGNYGQSTGDHLHMEVAKGKQTWDTGGLNLKNAYHMYDMLAVNDTLVKRGMNYNWRNYDGGVTPSLESRINKRFPWVLYAKKLRQGL